MKTRESQVADIEKTKGVSGEKYISVAKSKSLYDIAVNVVDFKEKAVGKIVQGEFLELLQSGAVSRKVIRKLESKEYSKNMFDINYPVLIKISSMNENRKGVDHTGVNRYYAKPIYIFDDLYLLTSQWYDKNKEKLIAWICRYRR